MKIRPDQILSKQARTQSKEQSSVQDQEKFQKIMKEKLDQYADQSKVPLYSAPDYLTSLGGTLQLQMDNNKDEPGSAQGLGGELESILEKWENYSQKLASPSVSLKDSYEKLSELSNLISQLKNDHSQELENSPQLKNLLTELEVLSVTEQIKFNRGDYLG